MHKADNRNYDGDLLTIQQACERTNLGRVTLMRIAKEAGAIRRIGNQIVRVDRGLLLKHINNEYAD